MPHPHGSGCRCPPPALDDGLLAYTVDCAHYDALRVVLDRIADAPKPAPLGDLLAPRCDGTLACRCEVHAEQRRLQVAGRAREFRQPWEPRPARRRAA